MIGLVFKLAKWGLIIIGLVAAAGYVSGRLSADSPAVGMRFPGHPGPKSPYAPWMCQEDPATRDCQWWVSQRGDVWIPWQSALIVPAGPQPNAPSGGHVMARDVAHLGAAMVLEAASLRGVAVAANRGSEPGQVNVLEIPNPSEMGEVYFPGRVAVGEHSDTFTPESAVAIPRGYLQLRVWTNDAPEADCQWPKHGGRVAVVIEAESGADTMGWVVCGPKGWEDIGDG